MCVNNDDKRAHTVSRSRSLTLLSHSVSLAIQTDGKQGNSVEELSLSCYKKVAVVENFYDIIYNVHVEMDGRSGKHAGQKRTYRAVSSALSFLFSSYSYAPALVRRSLRAT